MVWPAWQNISSCQPQSSLSGPVHLLPRYFQTAANESNTDSIWFGDAKKQPNTSHLRRSTLGITKQLNSSQGYKGHGLRRRQPPPPPPHGAQCSKGNEAQCIRGSKSKLSFFHFRLSGVGPNNRSYFDSCPLKVRSSQLHCCMQFQLRGLNGGF